MGPPRSRIQKLNLEVEEWLFVRSLNNDSRAYRNLAMELIFLCRFVVEKGSKSSIQLRKWCHFSLPAPCLILILVKSVLIAADDALKSAAEAGDKISEEVDMKFRESIYLLGPFERDSFLKDLMTDQNISGMAPGEAKIRDKSESILCALKKNLHANVGVLFVSIPLDANEF